VCRHFILPFHDSTFECVAHGFEVHFHRGSVSSGILAAIAMLRDS
jgi:hypothetical protein